MIITTLEQKASRLVAKMYMHNIRFKLSTMHQNRFYGIGVYNYIPLIQNA